MVCFKVNVNKRIWKVLKLMTPEIKKEKCWNVRFIRDYLPDSKHENLFCNVNGSPNYLILNALCFFFSFNPHKNIHKLIVLFSLLCVDFGLWCELFAGNIALGAPVNLFWFRLLLTIIWLHIHTAASTIKVLQQSSWKLS